MLNQLTVNNLQNPTASPTNSLFSFFKKMVLGLKIIKINLKKKKRGFWGINPGPWLTDFLTRLRVEIVNCEPSVFAVLFIVRIKQTILQNIIKKLSLKTC